MCTAGLVFHVVNRAAKRATLFESAPDYDAFERVLSATIERRSVAVFAYCVMPNHWHLVLSPRTDGALSRFMHWLTTTHARRWQNVRGLEGQGAVYQGRYKAIPVGSDRHFLWVCRYVERNPLRAGLVERAEDWRWSSLTRRQADDRAWLSTWPVPRPHDWLKQVHEPQTQAEVESFKKAMASEEPFGEADWCDTVKARIGITRSRRGRPRKMTPDPITDM